MVKDYWGEVRIKEKVGEDSSKHSINILCYTKQERLDNYHSTFTKRFTVLIL